MSDAETLNNVIASVISASPLLLSLAPFAAALKVWITKDLVTKQDCENYIDRLRKDLTRELEEKESYIQAVDKKANQNGKDIAEIRGRMG